MKNQVLSAAVIAASFAGLTQAANEIRHAADPGGNLESGVIYAANEARFSSANFSQPLTAYSVGWTDPDKLDVLLEQLAPSVEVSRRFEFKSATNAEAFLSETDDIRAIGSAFKRVEYTGSSVNEKTINKGLTIRIDHDDTVGDGWREQAVSRLMSRLLRNEVRRATALLTAAATNANKTWSSGTPNPDGDLRDALKLGADSSGIWPNTVAMAETAIYFRASAYEAANTPYAGVAAAMSFEQLAKKLMVDTVIPVKARYQSTLTAKAAVQTAGTIMMYFAKPGLGKDDPSNIKRFVTPASAGRFGVYVVEHEKFTDISVEHYSNSVITSTLGIRQITVS